MPTPLIIGLAVLLGLAVAGFGLTLGAIASDADARIEQFKDEGRS